MRTDQHFSMVAGNSTKLSVVVTDQSGAIIPLAGAAIKWVYGMGANVYGTKQTGSGIVITDAEQGIFSIMLDPEDTRKYSGSLDHECTITDEAGNVYTIFSGQISLIKPMTV